MKNIGLSEAVDTEVNCGIFNSYIDIWNHLCEDYNRELHEIKTENVSCFVKYNPSKNWIEWTITK